MLLNMSALYPTGGRTAGVAQQQSACLAHVRPCIQFPGLSMKKRKIKCGEEALAPVLGLQHRGDQVVSRGAFRSLADI